MKQFQYLFVTVYQDVYVLHILNIDNKPTYPELTNMAPLRALNALGADGWEYVDTQKSESGENHYRMLMKREVTEPNSIRDME